MITDIHDIVYPIGADPVYILTVFVLVGVLIWVWWQYFGPTRKTSKGVLTYAPITQPAPPPPDFVSQLQQILTELESANDKDVNYVSIYGQVVSIIRQFLVSQGIRLASVQTKAELSTDNSDLINLVDQEYQTVFAKYPTDIPTAKKFINQAIKLITTWK